MHTLTTDNYLDNSASTYELSLKGASSQCDFRFDLFFSFSFSFSFPVIFSF